MTILKNANAENLLECLLEATDEVQSAKLIGMSMDGPSVNWKLFGLLNEERTKKNEREIIDTGSCSLHIVNGAFKWGFNEGASCEIRKILTAMVNFFYNAPAPQGVNIHESG